MGQHAAVYRYINGPIGKMAINVGPGTEPRGDIDVSVIVSMPTEGTGASYDKPLRWLVGYLVHNSGASDDSLPVRGSALRVPYEAG